MDIEATGQTAHKQRRFGVLAISGIVVGVVLSIMKAVIWSSGSASAEACGYALAGVSIPGLIAFAIAGLGNLRNPNRFALAFGALCLVFVLLEVSHPPENPKDRAARLAREAAGTKPVEGSSTETDRLSRTMLREILDLRKSHDTKIAAWKVELSNLYSVDSFSSVAKMQRCTDAVRGTLSADQEFSRQFRVWKDRIKNDVDHSSLSGSEKQDFMKGVNQTMGNSKIVIVRSQAVDAEAKWADSTVRLYSFAMANTDKITLDGSKLVISDDKVRARFNRELEDCKNVCGKMRYLNSLIARLQSEGMQEMGITRKDIGLPVSNPPASH